MTPNPYVSYFLKAETDPDTAAAIRTAAFGKQALEGFQATYGNDGLTFELKDGSTPQDDGVEKAFLELSREFPGTAFHMQRTCEEPWLPDRMAIYENGKTAIDRLSRIVEPETGLDAVTVTAIARELENNGMHEAARLTLGLAGKGKGHRT